MLVIGIEELGVLVDEGDACPGDDVERRAEDWLVDFEHVLDELKFAFELDLEKL